PITPNTYAAVFTTLPMIASDDDPSVRISHVAISPQMAPIERTSGAEISSRPITLSPCSLRIIAPSTPNAVNAMTAGDDSSQERPFTPVNQRVTGRVHRYTTTSTHGHLERVTIEGAAAAMSHASCGGTLAHWRGRGCRHIMSVDVSAHGHSAVQPRAGSRGARHQDRPVERSQPVRDPLEP